jgi:hypothetical protein
MKSKKILLTILALFLCVMTLMPPNAYAHYSGGQTTSVTLDITYESRNVAEITTDYTLPPYQDISHANNCAPVAGSCIIGYYDRLYENLLPNHTNYYIENGVIHYAQNQPVDDMIDSLYSLMQTNVYGDGTSEANFKNGLAAYVNGQGYNITYTSLMPDGKFSLGQCTNTFFNSERPVAILMTGYSYYPFGDMNQSPNHDTFYGRKSTNGKHVVIAYGYRQYNYWRYETKSVWSPVWYNPFRFIEVTEYVNFRIEHYLLISFGDGTRGMLHIGDKTTTQLGANFDSAYGITIS